MPTPSDPAAETLLLPFTQGSLAWPQGPVTFLRARNTPGLRTLTAAGQLCCMQSFRPLAAALEAAGWAVADPLAPSAAPADGSQSLVLVLPPRQRDEARALLAEALALAAPGARVVACQANNEGARSSEADLAALAGLGGSLSKHHCRVYWTPPLGDEALGSDCIRWRALDAAQPIEAGPFLSRPGLFAWDRVDPASALLAAHLPDTLTGAVADLGCGYGYLSAHLLQHCPGIRALGLYEAEARALQLAQQNIAPLSGGRSLSFHWHDVTRGLDERYDAIVMNPPFHAAGREDRSDVGVAFIAAAASALRPGGALWMVANRHLPYESILRHHFGSFEICADQQGFKVIHARQASPR